MTIVDLSGAVDIHIHSNPSLFTRIGSDMAIARHAAQNGLAAIVLKNHFESTVGRAFLTDEAIADTHVFGGLVLNHFTGGLNPVAVEHAIRLGAKQIWMPTTDALGHAKTFGHAGGYGYQESNTKIAREGITVLDARGELTAEAQAIVDLVAEADIMLGTAHLSRNEIFVLAAFAQKQGLKKLIVTHPYFDPPKLSVQDQVRLAGLGATIELCGGNLYPIPGVATLSDYLNTISQVDVSALIISSDSGQPRKSMPAEVLRVFTQCLMDKGITQAKIDLMVKTNPARMLDLN
jgi:hypothetical protein